MPESHTGYLPWVGASFCSPMRTAEVQAFFSSSRIEALPGGPRNLQKAVEVMTICSALVDAHRDGARAFFTARSN